MASTSSQGGTMASTSKPGSPRGDWYDPQESEQDYEHPKFWSEQDEEVIVGIKQRDARRPIPLSTLCGTYSWFYEFPEPGLSEPIDVPYPPGTKSLHADPKGPGYLIISCPRKTNPTLKNITGTVLLYGKRAQFSGIKRAKDRDKNLATNHWEFVSFKWKENYDDCQDDGCALLALEVSDDEGDPFVMFRSASPAGRGGDSWYLDVAAKKERRTKEYGLSSAEMKRLGMQAQYPEVRAAALAAKQEEEEEEEESESESESDSEQDSSPVGKRRKRKPDSEDRPRKRKLRTKQ